MPQSVSSSKATSSPSAAALKSSKMSQSSSSSKATSSSPSAAVLKSSKIPQSVSSSKATSSPSAAALKSSKMPQSVSSSKATSSSPSAAALKSVKMPQSVSSVKTTSSPSAAAKVKSTSKSASSSSSRTPSPSRSGRTNQMEEFKANHVSFGKQLGAMLTRNLLLKKRNYKTVLTEIIFPLVYLLLTYKKGDDRIEVIPAIDKPLIDATLHCDLRGSTSIFTLAHLEEIFQSPWYVVNAARLNQTTLDHLGNLIEEAAKKICPVVTQNKKLRFYANFSETSKFETYYLRHRDEVKLALYFSSWHERQFEYSIRMPSNSVPGSERMFGSIDDCANQSLLDGKNCQAFDYYHSGFSTIQAILDSALVNFLRPNNEKSHFTMPNLRLGLFPQPSVKRFSGNHFDLTSQLSINFLVLMALIPTQLVAEKENRIKEAMFLMGLRRRVYWLGWLLTEALITFVICASSTLVIFYMKIITYQDPLVIFTLLQVYAFTLIALAFIISCFCSKAKTASVVSVLFSIFASFAANLFSESEMNSAVYKTISYFFSPFAFTFGIVRLVNSLEKITFADFGTTKVGHDVSSTLITMTADFGLYMVLAIILDYYFSRESNGLWNLFCLPNDENETKALKHIKVEAEEVSRDIRSLKAIRIDHVTKEFDNGHVTAVSDLSLDIYESQITAILGQNGAGKTTLINMLLGSYCPTSGRIVIYERDVQLTSQLDELRTQFGVCFQEDILFDDLSVVEHLEFYGKIKGSSELHPEIYRLLDQVELSDQRKTLAKDLSGGEKRKLCILIALIGQSRIVFLDEPTSGIDAYSRQCIWSLLSACKRNRVIILTTHFMDEADLLSDRKAIIVNGQLRCVGSSLFLKNKFGVGYHLRIELDDEKSANRKAVLGAVQLSVGGATLDRETNLEMMFTLPRTESEHFPALFHYLDDVIKRDESGVKNYGVTLTTLEDVFLKISYENLGGSGSEKVKIPDASQTQIVTLNQLTYCPSSWQKCFAFSMVRYKLILRDWIFLLNILGQVVLILLMAVLENLIQRNRDSSEVMFGPHLYDDNVVLYQDNYDNGSEPNSTQNIINHLSYNGFHPQQVPEINLNTSYNRHYALRFEEDLKTTISLIFNKSYLHALPILQNAFSNAFASVSTQQNNTKPLIIIKTTNHPLPVDEMRTSSRTFVISAFVIQILMILVPSQIAIQVVEDRCDKIKPYLHSNGLSVLEYWNSTWVVHWSLLAVIVVGIWIVTVTALSFGFQDPTAVILLLLLLLLFSLTSLLINYLLCHLFNQKDTARAYLPSLGVLGSMLLFVLIFMNDKHEMMKTMQILILIVPFTVPFVGTYAIGMVAFMNQIAINQEPMSYYTWDNNVTPCFASLLIHTCLCWVLLPWVDQWKAQSGDSECCCSCTCFGSKSKANPSKALSEKELDQDVVKEKKRVDSIMSRLGSNLAKAPLLVLQDVCKRYPGGKLAVNSVNLVIDSGQIFGLLGPNGAGKSTTMKIIVREECESKGSVVLNGNLLEPYSSGDAISYCPQNNPFWQNITLGEYLAMFASIHGVVRKKRGQLCHELIQVFDIDKHVNKKISALSGGTKRKLCLLIAVMANRELTLLDEPSTGMDPKSKRFMWNIMIGNFEPNGSKSAILTTHSMEEVEALCTRLAIMANGTIRCIGSIQHLNAKYGTGYILELKWSENLKDFDTQIEPELREMLPNMTIKERQMNRVKIDVPRKNILSFGTVFQRLQQLIKKHPEIEDYGLAQSSIEHVFIEFAKQDEQNC